MPSISFVKPPGVSNDHLVEDEVYHMTDYFNRRGDIPGIWYKWDLGSTIPADPNFYSEDSYISTVMAGLDRGMGLVPHEIVLIPHSVARWGYGLSSPVTLGNKECYGCLINADDPVKTWVTRLMCWHEPGHIFFKESRGEPNDQDDENGHGQATVELENGMIQDITPMGTAYARDSDKYTLSDADTRVGGTGAQVSDFPTTDNYQGNYSWWTNRHDLHKFGVYSHHMRTEVRKWYNRYFR